MSVQERAQSTGFSARGQHLAREYEIKKNTRLRPRLNRGKQSENHPRTGAHCLHTGSWSPTGKPVDAAFITEGGIMPASNGQAASWTWVSVQPLKPLQPKHQHPERGVPLDRI
jgi:hypothetical protein